jgi:uncharacterized membrane protein YoaK (UPF0700 family)
MPQEPYPNRVLVALLHLSTLVTGLVDAVSFIGLGHVFTANMTGNVVFLGFAAAGTPGLSVWRSLAALAAFFVGALIGGRVSASLAPISRHRWVTTAFGIEALLMLSAALASIGYRPSSADTTRLYAVIVLTALAMGVRNAAVRKMGVPDLTTTVLTLTITGLAADSLLAGGSKTRWQRRALAVVLMFAGAAAGALLLKHSLTLPLAVAAFSALCAVAVLFAKRETLETNTDT